ncbi:hypothetical protein NMY22_g11696 [Coprinellus aureogranulatus]|nr:hypothetical protein NMY22_g11696 [Coprinellus aureogranulatus]
MGRRAKYWTNEERLKARRERRASRASTEHGKAVKSQENRRYYQKKRGLQLLKEPTPTNGEPIRVLAAAEISSPEYHRLFAQFCGGRVDLGFDEFELDESDFEKLTGLPPYPESVASMSSLEEDGARLYAAMHGFATHKYLDILDQTIRSSVSKADYELIYDLLQHRERLRTEYNTLKIAHRESLQSSRRASGVQLARYTGTKGKSTCRAFQSSAKSSPDHSTICLSAAALVRKLRDRYCLVASSRSLYHLPVSFRTARLGACFSFLLCFLHFVYLF